MLAAVRAGRVAGPGFSVSGGVGAEEALAEQELRRRRLERGGRRRRRRRLERGGRRRRLERGGRRRRDGGLPARCTLPSETGTCDAYFPMYFHNPLTGVCEPFVYGGCGGNDNRFETREACQAACRGGTPDMDAVHEEQRLHGGAPRPAAEPVEGHRPAVVAGINFRNWDAYVV